jgi:steroid 5-alpha reductase family enzyme
MAAAIALAAAIMVVAMSAAWLAQRRGAGSGWIDVTWTLATGLACVVAAAGAQGDVSRCGLVIALCAAWSLRLGRHLVARTRRTPVDARYTALIEGWGASAALRLFLFLQIQAGAGFVLALAAARAASGPRGELDGVTLVGAALALAAIVGEAVADRQLAACKRAPSPSRICERGLWAASRHPNYFFEWLFWVALALVALAPPVAAWDWAALAAPAMMYATLRYGSGVPHVEAHMARTRPAAFAAYAARTPIFFPRLNFRR